MRFVILMIAIYYYSLRGTPQSNNEPNKISAASVNEIIINRKPNGGY